MLDHATSKNNGREPNFSQERQTPAAAQVELSSAGFRGRTRPSGQWVKLRVKELQFLTIGSILCLNATLRKRDEQFSSRATKPVDLGHLISRRSICSWACCAKVKLSPADFLTVLVPLSKLSESKSKNKRLSARRPQPLLTSLSVIDFNDSQYENFRKTRGNFYNGVHLSGTAFEFSASELNARLLYAQRPN